MKLLEQAAQAMNELLQKTQQLKHGTIPGAYELSGIQSELVNLYWKVGQEYAGKYAPKERAYLARRIASAEQFKRGRYDDKLSATEAREVAILGVGEEIAAEIDTATEFMQYKTLLEAIDRAISHSSQVISLVKTAESRA